MKRYSRILSLGLGAAMAIGLIAAPCLASAQSYRHRSNTRSEDSARANALALGGAGVLLMANHQQTLGEIALGAAALEGIQMQNDINNRHDRYSRYGDYRYSQYDNRYDNRYSDRYDNHYGSRQYSDRDDDRDDNRSDRGHDWAASRGEKRGWDKNGKR